MNHKIKNQISISCILLSIFIVGCQKQNTSNTPEKTQEQIVQSQISASEVVIPMTVSNCDQVDANIIVLKKTYDPEKLVELNQLFKTCLASVSLEKRYEWLEASNQIYKHIVQHTSEDLDVYISNIDENYEEFTPEQRKKIYQKLSLTEKYLVDQMQTLYLERFDEGEGFFSISVHPQYYLDIFSSHFPIENQIYFQQLRKEYTGITWVADASLAISFDEVADRLIFWEKYLKLYPKSYFVKQVKELIQEYRIALFIGYDNTPVFEYYTDNIISTESINAITKISKTDTSSQPIAKKLLEITQLEITKITTLKSELKTTKLNDQEKENQLEDKKIEIYDNIENTRAMLLKKTPL